MGEWFKLFSSCRIVNGASQDMIYDLERNEFYDIPHNISHLLKLTETKSVSELIAEYGDSIQNILDQFVSMELGFFTKTPERFPELDLTWESPYRITNAILEIGTESIYVKPALQELDELGAIGYQLRFIEALSGLQLKKILGLFAGSRAKFIEVLYPFNSEIDHNFFAQLWAAFPRIISTKIYGAPTDEIVDLGNKRKLAFAKKDITKDPNEIISSEYFITGVPLFAEAQHHNLGLNRKVSINQYGKIKNYLNHETEFGIVGMVKIKELIKDQKFNKYWYISNDEVEVCKDCQYRYTCVSNSEIKTKGGKNYKVSMCNFNPYTNEWQTVLEHKYVND